MGIKTVKSPGEMPSWPESPSPKRTAPERQRSRTGCRTCRSRKVKCDETPGGCTNCERLGLCCPNSPAFQNDPLPRHKANTSHSHTSGAVGSSKKLPRTYRSCRCCRISKSRCSGERPLCLRCRQRGYQCSYDGREAPIWAEILSSGMRTSSSVSDADDAYQARAYSEAPTTQAEISVYDPSDLSWLMSPKLPDRQRLEMLIGRYFARIHHTRSFAFIHKPTFMEQIQDESLVRPHGRLPLLYTMCALGAKFFALEEIEANRAAAPFNDFVLQAGKQWAQKAREILLGDLNSMSVEATMAIVLLHDHDLRVGDYASAFVLTGISVRMSQALQLSLETSPIVISPDTQGLPPIMRESRRRLAWAIYVMDAWTGRPTINDNAMRIQLPCSESTFEFGLPCVVPYLVTDQVPGCSPRETKESASSELDSVAQFIRLVKLRRQVLCYIKQLGSPAALRHPASEYTKLLAGLDEWYEQLALNLRLEHASIQMRKDYYQLGGLVMLHVTYHQTMCDLTQTPVEHLFSESTATISAERDAFQKKMQDDCFQHATSIAAILAEAIHHGVEVLADTWLGVAAHSSCVAIVRYMLQDLGTAPKDHAFRQRAISCLDSNIRALERMVTLHAVAKPLYAAAVNMMKHQGLDLSSPLAMSEASELDYPSSALEYPQSLQAASPHFDPMFGLPTTQSGRDEGGWQSSPPNVDHTSQEEASAGLVADAMQPLGLATADLYQLSLNTFLPPTGSMEYVSLDGSQLPRSCVDLQGDMPYMAGSSKHLPQPAYMTIPLAVGSDLAFADLPAYDFVPSSAPEYSASVGTSTSFAVTTEPAWAM